MILLVQPPAVDGSTFYELPLNLAYIASACIAAGLDVDILDMQIETEQRLYEILQNQYDVIGFATYSYTIGATKRLCELIRPLQPTAVLVLGGAHATFSTIQTLESISEADYVIQGEAEERFVLLCQLVADLRHEDIEKIYGVVGRNNISPTISLPQSDINQLALASDSFHLFNLKRAMELNSYFPLIASRGCPYRCSYCASPIMWGRPRIRSSTNLFSEIEQLKKYGIKHLNFRDDAFSALQSLHRTLLPFLSQAGIKWGCEFRLDDADENTIRSFVASGMAHARVAVESIHEKSLKKIRKRWKNCSVDERIYRIKLLTTLCESVRVSFMIGIPGETKEDIFMTFNFAEKLRPATCAFWAYSPLPGTPIYKFPKKHGITKILPHDQLDPLYSVIETRQLSNQEINELIKEAHARFPDNRFVDSTGRKKHAL